MPLEGSWCTSPTTKKDPHPLLRKGWATRPQHSAKAGLCALK